MLIINERSMINGSLLRAAKWNVRQCIFGQKNIDKLWGGLPVMLYISDDYQLLSVEKE